MSEKIMAQWPAALLFLSGSLKTGLTLEQSLGTLACEAPEPLKSYLQRHVGKNETVENQIQRMLAEKPLALARAALLLSHRSGGQAARLLEVSAAQLQEKIEMMEKTRALSAQSRASAWIVGLSPFGLLMLMHLLAPDYTAPLFETRAGAAVLSLVLLLVGVGLIMVQRMARVDIE